MKKFHCVIPGAGIKSEAIIAAMSEGLKLNEIFTNKHLQRLFIAWLRLVKSCFLKLAQTQ